MAEFGPIAGIILAGGLARRMGPLADGNKALANLAGKPILDRVIERIAPQVDQVLINANGPAERFAAYGLPVASDTIAGHAGPLAGILAGLDWVVENIDGAKWALSVACDAPFLPKDLLLRLMTALNEMNADMACAASGGRHHPVIGLWPVALRDELRAALIADGVRKVDLWTGRYKLAVAEFSGDPIDPFFNVNKPDDLERAKTFAEAGA